MLLVEELILKIFSNGDIAVMARVFVPNYYSTDVTFSGGCVYRKHVVRKSMN